MPDPSQNQNLSAPRLVEEAWNHVAAGYRSYWSCRFEPYLQAAVNAFQPPPEGAIVVPGCGPGDEVLLLARKFPGRAILATDLSPAMVQIAGERVREAGLTHVLIAQDDAAEVSSRLHRAGGIFSAFAIQLLPEPLAALADWAQALRAGGRIALLFWPRDPQGGAFFRLGKLLREKLGEERPEWEMPALESLPELGLELLSEQSLAFEMSHDSPPALWRAAIECGPLQVHLRRLGKARLDEVGEFWLKDHGLETRGGIWLDRPAARLWILERTGLNLGYH